MACCCPSVIHQPTLCKEIQMKFNLLKSAMAVIMTVAIPVFAFCGDKSDFKIDPKTNNGQKWRIGYYEGGEYIDYKGTLIATVKGLMEIGWIEQMVIPEVIGERTDQIWQWLASDLRSDYIEFVADAHYSANWDDNLREKIMKKITNRLNNQKDIDLMIAMGTWAGKDLANDTHDTPVMVLTASDAVGAGIIKNIEDSGFSHVHAHVDPSRYERQIEIFHDIMKFKRLGIAYEDTVDGRSYASLDIIEKVAADKNFEIIRCFTKSDIVNQDLAGKSVLGCFEKLVPKVDAIYVTLQGGVNSKTVPKLAEIANKRHIPTFSQSGSDEVKSGFLLSISHGSFKYVGLFHAKTFASVFNGVKPNQLDQVFEGPPKIAINLKTAELIGFNPPMVLLGAADEMYNDIVSSR
jgi:ABC-type uncharacterized transport system substrate-binding protein